MKVIVTGATGLVGRALIQSLLADGHEVTRLVRGGAQGFRAPGTAAVHWDPERGEIDAKELEGHDAAVHLAGESIAEGRWDDEKKRRILESRVKGTRLIAETLAGLNEKPKALVSASAVGFYGDRGDELLREESASGTDFLSEVCREWEKATLPASQAGLRVVHLRIGVVLDAEGGALPRMLTPFKLGLGGRVGSGRQYMSWITLDDLVARHPPRDRGRELARARQRGRAAGGDERGVHEGARARARTPDHLRRARVRGAARLRRDGRRAAALGRARRAGTSERGGIRV